MENFISIPTLIKKYYHQLLDFIPHIIAAILILVVGLWLTRLFIKYVKKYLALKDYDLAFEQFIVSILNIILKLAVFITAASQLGIQTTSFIAIIGSATLAIGLALQGSLSNFAGGILIIILKPFKIDDYVEAQGVLGTVKSISLFYTKIKTDGNQLAVIPNGILSNNKVINYTSEGKRRDKIAIKIPYNADLKLAKDILLQLLNEQKNILKTPAPRVLLESLDDSVINLSIRYWATTKNFWDCHWYTMEQIKIRLDEAGISAPNSSHDVFLYKQNTPPE
ncbi:small conductance mechanosensitive channel [Mesonia hippocampi]|uniref:Small conductance mechanosensitive channel n=1 Tax=Mesonia hippocampi TaxID=1628250 RepID=A0A840ETJ9_9FLAO|nr:mechanosensitive ion channel domain-containing protein [Mesonia hippocampi]MBB4118766.1 small conductance mechanosensitive channel [Mesonia hippocampi]